MSLPTPPLRVRTRVLLGAAQTDQGTAATLDVTTGAFNVYTDDSPIKMTINKDERRTMDGGERLPSSLGSQMATLTFDAEIVGAATVPAFASTFLPACGFVFASRTFTFNPLGISPLPLMTLAINDGGRMRKIIDALGTVKFAGDAGKWAKATFVFTGNLADDADVTMVHPARPATMPSRWVTPMTLGSLSPKVSKFEIDAGTDVVMREAATPTGFYSALPVDWDSSLSIDPEADLVANAPLLSLQKSSTELAWSIQLGTVANGIVTFAGSRAECIENDHATRNKMITDTTKFRLNDRFAVAFS